MMLPVTKKEKHQFFPRNFIPGPNDVIIGRGKKCYEYVGNVNFRKIVASKLDEYLAAGSRQDKSNILASVMSNIRNNSINGGFIKQDCETGLWFKVGDFVAREKTSQAFRDALHDNYRSSNSFKKKRRRRLLSKSRQSISKKVHSKPKIDIHPKEEEGCSTYSEQSLVKESGHNKLGDSSSHPKDNVFTTSLQPKQITPESSPVSRRKIVAILDDFDLFDGLGIGSDIVDDSADLMSTCSSLCFDSIGQEDSEKKSQNSFW